MNMARVNVFGSPFVGIYSVCNESLCFLPQGVDQKTKEAYEKALDVKAVEVSLYGSPLLGVFSKMNNRCIYLPSLVSSHEVELIEREIKVKILNTHLALGNLVELNDSVAIVSPLIEKRVIDVLSSDLKVLTQKIGGVEATGSSIILTNNGFLISARASMEEIRNISEITKLKGGSSTANRGDSMIRNSMIANSKGFVAGAETTGFELAHIEDALYGDPQKKKE
jgi:translation initiation factor 6